MYGRTHTQAHAHTYTEKEGERQTHKQSFGPRITKALCSEAERKEMAG